MAVGYMSESDRKVLHDALIAAEKRTHAHLAVVITPISERYLMYPLAWAVAGTFAAGAALAAFWPHLPLRFGLVIEADFFVGLALILDWLPVRLLLVPRRIKHKHCTVLARREFAARILADPKHRPGLLLFVSLRERYVEVLADNALHTRVGEHTWDGLVSGLIEVLKADRPMIGGLTDSVETCAQILESHCSPIAEENF